ncbi:MAG TPA: AMP-binding protein [Streptosporangiaceae bacterium]|jgi:cyclohexanecarboxylate-CoA ligase|nr:AMP-binding protein [Streptosporangiaceae bacterium]
MTADPFPGRLLRAESFWELVTARAAATGDAPMLIDASGRVVSFREFNDYSERMAVTLAAQGVGPGSRVAWQLPTRVSTVIVMGALARLSAVQAPVIPIYRERETSAAVATAGAEFMLVPGTWRGFDYAAMAAGLPTAPKVIVVGEPAPPASAAALASLPAPAASAEWVYFTSGSSGLPKGARHTDATLLAAAYGWTSQGRVGEFPDDVGSMAFPVAHVGGILYVMAQLISGFPAVLVESFDAATVEVFRRLGVTMSGGSTVFYTALLAAQRAFASAASSTEARVLPSLRVLKGGGAPCPPGVFWAVREEMGVTVAHDYGMTEVPMICVASPLDTDEQLANSDGRPIPGVEVRIVDDTVVLPAGVDGEIQVRGAAVCHGYTDPSLDASAFTPDGWFRTGDRGRLRPDGHVEVTGRTKDLIIRKGEKIAPLELETLLIQHPAVAEVAVIGLPDTERGERVCAVLTLRPGAVAPSLAEITAFLRGVGLMPQKLPEQVEIVSELPRTGLGKVAKLALREKFSGSRRRPAVSATTSSGCSTRTPRNTGRP